jgi:hypothetical protein
MSAEKESIQEISRQNHAYKIQVASLLKRKAHDEKLIRILQEELDVSAARLAEAL